MGLWLCAVQTDFSSMTFVIPHWLVCTEWWPQAHPAPLGFTGIRCEANAISQRQLWTPPKLMLSWRKFPTTPCVKSGKKSLKAAEWRELQQNTACGKFAAHFLHPLHLFQGHKEAGVYPSCHQGRGGVHAGQVTSSPQDHTETKKHTSSHSLLENINIPGLSKDKFTLYDLGRLRQKMHNRREYWPS